jgi:hypothetical protein
MKMAGKVFSRTEARPHFPELAQQNMAAFNQSTFYVEVDPGISPSDICDPMLWGAQRLVKRGDILHCQRIDNGFYGQFYCESTSAGYPLWRPIIVITRQQARQRQRITGDGIEYLPGLGWTAMADGEIIGGGGFESENAAEAALAQHRGEATA